MYGALITFLHTNRDNLTLESYKGNKINLEGKLCLVWDCPETYRPTIIKFVRPDSDYPFMADDGLVYKYALEL